MVTAYSCFFHCIHQLHYKVANMHFVQLASFHSKLYDCFARIQTVAARLEYSTLLICDFIVTLLYDFLNLVINNH